MTGVHILGDIGKPISALAGASKSRSSLQMYSLLVILVAGLLATAGCVGVTGKTATGGPPGGEDTASVIVTPSSADFGDVPIHTHAAHSFELTNNGTTDLTITKLSGGGPAYSTAGGGLSVNTTVKAGRSLKFSVEFTPVAAGNAPGNLLITTTADSTPAAVTLHGTGVGAAGETPVIDPTPSSINFGNVTVGAADTQTIRLKNTGAVSLKITKISAKGTGFGESGLSIPLTLSAGEDTTFTASFKPPHPGAEGGSIAISYNGVGSPISISMTGSGAVTDAKLTATASSLKFGTVAIGRPISQNLNLANIGNTDVVISSVAIMGKGFTSTGGANVTLTPGQSTDVAVRFDPRAVGEVTGSLTISSNATTLQIPLSGEGAGSSAEHEHAVALSWAPSVSPGVDYNVYRGTISGGPYTRLNAVVDSLTSYTDDSVSGGRKYYYVVTAVDAEGMESDFSSQASVTIPAP
jgi:hypothetical protein